jgi:hypothetical protein
MPDHELCCIRAVSRHDLEALIELCAEHATYEGARYELEGKADALARALFTDPPRLYAWVVERADWFGGLTIMLEDNGETLLTGRVLDQAAWYGLFRKVRDVGLPLLSVNGVQPGQAEASDGTQEMNY